MIGLVVHHAERWRGFQGVEVGQVLVDKERSWMNRNHSGSAAGRDRHITLRQHANVDFFLFLF